MPSSPNVVVSPAICALVQSPWMCITIAAVALSALTLSSSSGVNVISDGEVGSSPNGPFARTVVANSARAASGSTAPLALGLTAGVDGDADGSPPPDADGEGADAAGCPQAAASTAMSDRATRRPDRVRRPPSSETARTDTSFPPRQLDRERVTPGPVPTGDSSPLAPSPRTVGHLDLGESVHCHVKSTSMLKYNIRYSAVRQHEQTSEAA